jgi:hypothetical protein
MGMGSVEGFLLLNIMEDGAWKYVSELSGVWEILGEGRMFET